MKQYKSIMTKLARVTMGIRPKGWFQRAIHLFTEQLRTEMRDVPNVIGLSIIYNGVWCFAQLLRIKLTSVNMCLSWRSAGWESASGGVSQVTVLMETEQNVKLKKTSESAVRFFFNALCGKFAFTQRSQLSPLCHSEPAHCYYFTWNAYVFVSVEMLKKLLPYNDSS